ncbi:MAG: hypothetical protein WBQ34_07130 [Candidatus Acidiferrales bacterium]
MDEALQVNGDSKQAIAARIVLKVNPIGTKTECLFTDGTSILLPNILRGSVRAGDEMLSRLELGTADARTELYIRNTNPKYKRPDILHAEIGHATQPRKDKRGHLFVAADVSSHALGISAIHIRCETLRDYFYVGDRHRPFDRQKTFYQLLRVSSGASPGETRLAFKLRTLELRAAHAPVGDVRAVERAFNILANQELRVCYDALLIDSTSPALFPYNGFGSLLVAGECSRDGTIFQASHILAFFPSQNIRRMQIPLRKCMFYNDRALYRDARRKCEIMFDQAALPLSWDSTWNQWKHLVGAEIDVEAAFIQSGQYQRRGEARRLVAWDTALPSRIEINLPANVTEQVNEGRETHHRLGQFTEALDGIRTRTNSAPMERADLQKLCAGLGIPADFDVRLITWKPDYDSFYYRQLCKRARRLYLFRSEYIFELAETVVVETPQLGHATYLFSNPVSMTDFLALYAMVTREEILHNRNNVAEKLGFSGRIIHGLKAAAWMRQLRLRLGAAVESAEISD